MAESIFVFGSNKAGRHGRGAALEARLNHGAIYGQGEGIQGKSYAIPTKDEKLKVLPLDQISDHVVKFLKFANAHPRYQFYLTAIGTGLAGYSYDQIAPMFASVPANVTLPDVFIKALEKK